MGSASAIDEGTARREMGGEVSYMRGAAACSRREMARMLRFVVIALIVVLAWMLLMKVVRDIRAAKVDWKGWAFIAGFIALAFYLRHVTGIGEF